MIWNQPETSSKINVLFSNVICFVQIIESLCYLLLCTTKWLNKKKCNILLVTTIKQNSHFIFAGFRDRKESQNQSNRSQQRRKNSIETHHSFRSTSGSIGNSVGQGQGPPHGTRVVLGRETSPTPDTSQDPGHRLPSEIMDKFSGQTREVSFNLDIPVNIWVTLYLW